MKFVLAPHVLARPDGPRRLSPEDVARYPCIEVPDESMALLDEVVDEAIRTHADRVIEAESQLDAPPFCPGMWWLATVRDRDGLAEVTSLPPTYFYGIDEAGRVHFLHRNEIRVADFARALEEGHYGPTNRTLLITRAGQFGGNGAVVPSLVVWLLEAFPGVLLGLAADRLALRRDEAKREELQNLAAAWAARHIAFPSSLRQFVETRPVWYPEALARRLDLSPAAAARLLGSLGYQHCGEDMFEFDGSAEALVARARWLEAEQSHSGFTSLDELLDGPEQALEPAMPSLRNGARRTSWGRKLFHRFRN